MTEQNAGAGSPPEIPDNSTGVDRPDVEVKTVHCLYCGKASDLGRGIVVYDPTAALATIARLEAEVQRMREGSKPKPHGLEITLLDQVFDSFDELPPDFDSDDFDKFVLAMEEIRAAYMRPQPPDIQGQP